MIYLASDHGGFELKNQIKNHLEFRGFEVEDMGNHVYDENDDYPDFTIKAIEKVLEDPDASRAILLCRSGVGEVIMANKFKDIRATLSWTPEHARISREKNDANVLSLPADYLSIEDSIKIVNTWLASSFSQEERHVRRLKKIEKYGDTYKVKEKVTKLV